MDSQSPAPASAGGDRPYTPLNLPMTAEALFSAVDAMSEGYSAPAARPRVETAARTAEQRRAHAAALIASATQPQEAR